jgi:nucleoside-diphosphate-sugar epimerase
LISIIDSLERLLVKKARIDQKPFHIADIKETWADIEKASELLGWKPKVSLDEGLEKTVEWYLDNKNWLNEIAV